MVGTVHAEMAEVLYRADSAPWDIGEPQPAVRQLIAHGAVRGSVLDPGCGTGLHAIAYANAGHTVTGIDAAPTAIQRARENARTAGAAVEFRHGDVTQCLTEYRNRFDTVIDAKLWDNLPDGEARHSYATLLHHCTRPGARLILFAFGPGHINGVHNHLLEGARLRHRTAGRRLHDHLHRRHDLAAQEHSLRTDLQPMPPRTTTRPHAHPHGRSTRNPGRVTAALGATAASAQVSSTGSPW